MSFLRAAIAATLTLCIAYAASPKPAVAQGGPPPPIMTVRGWHTIERAGDTWDGTWTFTDRSHRVMTAYWVDRQNGVRVSAPKMFLHIRGAQITITRPGTGDYVGQFSPDGRSIQGSMSWVAGDFTAHMR
jgi:hypothetical protein